MNAIGYHARGPRPTALVFMDDDAALTQPGIIRTIYDPTAGTGGFLSSGMEYVHELNKNATMGAFGQELNPESYAICISAPPEIAFADVVKMIDTARQHAYQAVNTTLIELYWQVGAYISAKLAAAEWGDGVVDQLAHFLTFNQPGLRGFTRSNLFRMRQFYDTYRDAPKVAPLARQLSWTHNLIIMGQSKRAEEREFYLRMAVQEKWSKRELERQFRVALFERTVLEPAKVSATLRQSHHDALGVFKDSYLVEFLDLPQTHDEADLHHGLLAHLKAFLLELGRDFCFVGAEYQVQVGGKRGAVMSLYKPLVDNAVMDSGAAHHNQMMQYLSSPQLASGFARVIFDLMLAGKGAGSLPIGS